jgi:phenol 2-monooxygenase
MHLDSGSLKIIMVDTPAKEDHVDVLIVGAGPAGLMLANWLRFPECGIADRPPDH